jgi:hypothetical protein
MNAINKKILIGSSIAVVVIIIVIIVLVYYKKKKQKEQLDNNIKKEIDPLNKNKTDKKPKPVVDPLKDLPIGRLPLKLGDKNKLTGVLQMAMNDLWDSRLNVDGDFGTGLRDTLKLRYNKTECDSPLAQQIYKELYNAKASDSALNLFYNAFIKEK